MVWRRWQLKLEKDARDAKKGAAQRMFALAGVQCGQSAKTPEELATIRVPVICINGTHDTDNGDKMRLSELIPRSKLAWVEGDHAAPTMQLEFCMQIVSFISEHWPAGPGPDDAAAVAWYRCKTNNRCGR
mmetsp:Transcript_16237/g.31581  ORF Transcript_16237/g.31581 Transcript_16237/m.31581 type:complete len:130 (-) Transcript_16237:445-834(-)